jgi:U-box domain
MSTIVGANPTFPVICPITLALPCDPVTAEHGYGYEHSSIEEHIKIHSGVLKSPMTNVPMGHHLISAPHHARVSSCR